MSLLSFSQPLSLNRNSKDKFSQFMLSLLAYFSLFERIFHNASILIATSFLMGKETDFPLNKVKRMLT